MTSEGAGRPPRPPAAGTFPVGNVFALGAQAALATLDQNSSDVIVSDMKMPVMDGPALLERVRELHPQVVESS